MSIDLDDLLERSRKVPSVEDQLFIEAEDWWMNACFDCYHDPTELYIAGYKEAADLLVDSVSERKGAADSLIFPIVFLYRQYIELRLKSLIRDGKSLIDKEYKEKPEHRLGPLWLQVKVLFDEIFSDADPEIDRAIESLIQQFEEVDPRSTTFRYPKDFKGNNSLNINTPRVNLRNLYEVVNAMYIILEGSSALIGEYQGYKMDTYGY